MFFNYHLRLQGRLESLQLNLNTVADEMQDLEMGGLLDGFTRKRLACGISRGGGGGGEERENPAPQFGHLSWGTQFGHPSSTLNPKP